MDVRSAQHIAPVIEHNGTVPVWWLVSPRELHDVTRGGFLELVSEWEVAGGGKVDAHSQLEPLHVVTQWHPDLLRMSAIRVARSRTCIGPAHDNDQGQRETSD